MISRFWFGDLALWGGLAAAMALAGCSRSGPPAPVIHGDQAQGARSSVPQSRTGQQQASLPPPAQAPGRSVVPSGRSVVVKPGDTLYSIARDNGVPLRALIEANRLRAPFAVEPGRSLTLPVARYHVVRRGDTLYGIARLYGIAMRRLVEVNGIEPPYAISVGQKVALAPGGAAAGTRTARADTASADRPPVTTSDLPPPAASALPPERSRPLEPQTALRSPEPPAAPLGPQVEPPPRSADGRFLWPVRGRILLGFGPRGGGLHNDGINIAAVEGTEIRAAEAGVVVYAGNELQGFGNMLLLRHAGDFMTAYGHAASFTVRRGEMVRRGQVIGRVGRTGSVDRSQLHFEIRRSDKAVDPIRYLMRTARAPASATSAASRAVPPDPG